MRALPVMLNPFSIAGMLLWAVPDEEAGAAPVWQWLGRCAREKSHVLPRASCGDGR